MRKEFRMSCVLRVFGRALDVRTVTDSIAMAPFRIDDGATNGHGKRCLHYDIFVEERPFPRSIAAISNFIRTNEAPLTELSKRKDVEGMLVDIAIYVRDNDYLKNLTLDTNFIKDLAAHGLALTLSLHKTSDDDLSSWAAGQIE
jgi:hypothetical protein